MCRNALFDLAPSTSGRLDQASTSDGDRDEALERVVSAILAADPTGSRTARVLRRTFDQLYDGQRTGRYKWDQLYKTEKTHFGTLFEINLRRALDDVITDGAVLDYQIADSDVDCKYSFRFGGWMLPPECIGQLLLVCTASDEHAEWSLGVVRARPEYLRDGRNRDLKTGLNDRGRQAIQWLTWAASLPPNALLQAPPQVVDAIMGKSSGQRRLNHLFKELTNVRIGRNTVATVAQQDDYMKRVRYNGGSRSALQADGYIILGDYRAHQDIARRLGAAVPESGEFVSLRVTSCDASHPLSAFIEGAHWRIAGESEANQPAPTLSLRPS